MRTGEQLAEKHREISVSEFFEKNRHLLGFDNPSKALVTAIREAVDNALDACEEGGILPSVHVILENLSGGLYRLTVTDNGPGIPGENLERIFDPFFTTKEDQNRTGLGLAVAAGIIEQHAGEITVRSKPGEGTEFRVALPAMAAATVGPMQ